MHYPQPNKTWVQNGLQPSTYQKLRFKMKNGQLTNGAPFLGTH